MNFPYSNTPMNFFLHRTILPALILLLTASACGNKGPLVRADSVQAETRIQQKQSAGQKSIQPSEQKSSQPSQLQPSPFSP
jgi:predicted small lipoprotein YifL